MRRQMLVGNVVVDFVFRVIYGGIVGTLWFGVVVCGLDCSLERSKIARRELLNIIIKIDHKRQNYSIKQYTEKKYRRIDNLFLF